MRATTAILGALLAALLAFGCGGGSDSGGSSESAASGAGSEVSDGGDPGFPSRTAFVKQGNTICMQSEEERGKESKSIAGELSGSSEEELASFVSDVFAPSLETMTSELSDLGAPKEDAEQAEKMVAELESSLAKLESEPQLALEGDPFAAANKIAAELGLADCVI
jgi:hypothetical protein